LSTSGLHKGEEFFIIAGWLTTAFKNADGKRLMPIALNRMNHHLFKDHFCWPWPIDSRLEAKSCYKFCKRTGRQEIAYHAIRENGSIRFATGKRENFEIEPDEEIKF
jgi:hypothetical protein